MPPIPAPPLPNPVYQTADQYLLGLLQSLQQNSSRVTDFSVGSVARTLMQAFSLGLSQQSLVADQVTRNMLLATAVGSALDTKAGDYFVTRKAAVQAAGTVTVTRPANQPAVFVPQGWSQLLTSPAPGQQPIAFVTTSDLNMAQGATTATLNAQAVIGGAAGNIASGTVLLPNNPVSGIATNGGFVAAANFTGGG